MRHLRVATGDRPRLYHERWARWVAADVCETVPKRRRMALVPLLGAALSAVALAAGTTYAMEPLAAAGTRALGRPSRVGQTPSRGDADASAPTRAI